jgi:hypothetical protein
LKILSGAPLFDHFVRDREHGLARTNRGFHVVIADKSSRIGCVQLRIRRALIAANGKPVTIADLLPRCYPFAHQFKMWHRTNIHRALDKFAVEVDRRRSRGEPILWTLKSK